MQINRPELVPVKRYVRPDLTLIEKRKKYGDNYEFIKMSFVFNDMLVVEEECDEEGNLKTQYSRYIKYEACRRIGDDVCIMHKDEGWVMHEQATEILAEKIAERELLNG